MSHCDGEPGAVCFEVMCECERGEQGCYLSRKTVSGKCPDSGRLFPDICTQISGNIRPGGVRATSSTAATKEVHGAPAAAAVHGTSLVLTQVCLHTLCPPIWRLHGCSTTVNHEKRLSSRSAAGPPQRVP